MIRFTRLEAKRFGCLDNLIVDFSDGLNIISGGNETGKSTLVEALLAALFDLPGSESGRIEKYKNWNSDHLYLIYLEYRSDGKTYRLTKDFTTEVLALEEVESGERWSDPEDVQQHIFAALGLADENLLTSTAFIKQGEIADFSAASELIKEKLEKKVASGNADTFASSLLEKLNQRRAEIDHDDPYSPGELIRTIHDIEHWQKEAVLERKRIEELKTFRARLRQIRGESVQTKQEFDEKHERFRKSKSALEAEQNLEKERENFLELGRRTRDAQDVWKELSTGKEELKSLLEVERNELKDAESLKIQQTFYRSQLEDATSALQDGEEQLDEARPKIWYKILSVASFVGACGAGYLWHTSAEMPLLGIGVATLLVSLLSVVTWLNGNRRFRDATARHKSLDATFQKNEENLEKCEVTLTDLLIKYKTADVDELAEKYEYYRDLDREVTSQSERYESLLAGSNLKELEDDLSAMTERMNTEQETFNKFKAFTIDPEELEQLQREVTDLDRNVRQMDEEQIQLTQKLQFIEAGEDVLASLEERVGAGQRTLRLLTYERDLIKIICKNVEEARKQVLKSSVDLLETRASRFCDQITAGCWKFVKFDRQTLQCMISKGGEKWYASADGLSHSTLDAFYFAVRLALVEVLFERQTPPLVIEDPLVLMEESRRDAAIEIIDRLAENHQIIILTCQPWPESDGTNRINLHEKMQQSVCQTATV